MRRNTWLFLAFVVLPPLFLAFLAATLAPVAVAFIAPSMLFGLCFYLSYAD